MGVIRSVCQDADYALSYVLSVRRIVTSMAPVLVCLVSTVYVKLHSYGSMVRLSPHTHTFICEAYRHRYVYDGGHPNNHICYLTGCFYGDAPLISTLVDVTVRRRLPLRNPDSMT